MEHLIASYLFQNNYAPLPGIGKLILVEKPALIEHGARLIEAPKPVISMVEGNCYDDGFLNFASLVEKISREEARSRLIIFCSYLQGLDSFAEAKITNTGKFYVNAEGNLVFKQSTLPGSYLQSIAAEKIIHPDASHSLLVGDVESNTARMAEYYNAADPEPTQKWWIVALVLAAVGFIIIFFYYYNEKSSAMFGNAAKPSVRENAQTYTTPR